MRTDMCEIFDSQAYAKAWQLRNTELIENRKVMEMEVDKFLSSLDSAAT